jgi:hypothetical protein
MLFYMCKHLEVFLFWKNKGIGEIIYGWGFKKENRR